MSDYEQFVDYITDEVIKLLKKGGDFPSLKYRTANDAVEHVDEILFYDLNGFHSIPGVNPQDSTLTALVKQRNPSLANKLIFELMKEYERGEIAHSTGRPIRLYRTQLDKAETITASAYRQDGYFNKRESLKPGISIITDIVQNDIANGKISEFISATESLSEAVGFLKHLNENNPIKGYIYVIDTKRAINITKFINKNLLNNRDIYKTFGLKRRRFDEWLIAGKILPSEIQGCYQVQSSASGIVQATPIGFPGDMTEIELIKTEGTEINKIRYDSATGKYSEGYIF